MRNYFLITLLSFTCFFVAACKKTTTKEEPVKLDEQDVLNDFANVVVNPNYQDIQSKAQLLQVSIQQLSSSTTQSNLVLAQEAWRNVRAPWEKCEAFLFGPVEDFNYDPATDSWPVNKVELDSLLASSNPLSLADIDALPFSLKGYHAIEYLLFGVGGTQTAAQLTNRQLLYLNSLAQSLYNSTTDLRNSWDVSVANNFTVQFTSAGHGSTRYSSRKEAFVTLVTAMASICIELANAKMNDPLTALDSTLVESQYAHNATEDFRNNLRGVKNAYMCTYHTTGKSLHDLVASYDLSFDNTITSQIDAAIQSLLIIDDDYGKAIFTQFGQIQNAQISINTLEGTLNQLINFLQTNIKD